MNSSLPRLCLRGGIALGFVAILQLLPSGFAAEIVTTDNHPAPSISQTALPLFDGEELSLERELQTLKQRRFHELRQQLEELARHLDATLAPATPTTEFFEESPQTLKEELDTESAPQPVPAPQHSSTVAQPESPLTFPASPPEQGPPIQDPLHGPVDRCALASSLFGTAEYELCLQIIEQLDSAKLTRPEQLWCEYLVASCHRKLGNTTEAQKHYRRLITHADADWIGDLSKWWLANLDEKARLQSDVQALKTTLANWEAEIAKFEQKSN
ncbi:hypothetical protein [Planctomicrobium sp. SH664]|uniref:hypothetical protein n=1 Tax=Planctomicrobium sp. SH664 TaxID=3448125 RepID=UPI003F5B9279